MSAVACSMDGRQALPARVDRTVHARTEDGHEIVRYDRAGKWYVEWESAGPNGGKRVRLRRAVPVSEAAALARRWCEDIYLGLPGGGTFDRLARPEPTE